MVSDIIFHVALKRLEKNYLNSFKDMKIFLNYMNFVIRLGCDLLSKIEKACKRCVAIFRHCMKDS